MRTLPGTVSGWGSILTALAALATLAGPRPGSGDLVAVVALVAAVALAAAIATRSTRVGGMSAGRPAEVFGAALRERSRHSGTPRHRDPDARGRRRPRAPSARPPAA